MLKIIRYILSIVTILFAAYGLVTTNFKFNDIMLFLLGLTMLINGLVEFQGRRKANGWLFVFVSLFVLFVSVEGFLLN
ncbi:DUF3953 domain-containing protein [Priestia filamentosa]|uniref:DUF3953 domain-containing protein n=1 Tax=Priestia filamentosa TaxID=1402861 RepID=UPI003981D477